MQTDKITFIGQTNEIEDRLVIHGKDFENFEDMIYSDDLFMNDLTLEHSYYSDLWYIQDSNQGLWYSIENGYCYGGIDTAINQGKDVIFYLITDEEILSDLEKEFN